YYRAAGARYQSALVISQVLQLEINMVLVGSYAEDAGTPSKIIEDNLSAFDGNMYGLVQAAANVDVAQMTAAMAAALPKFQEASAMLDKAIKDIGANAQLSQKVIAVADILLLAFNIYEVWNAPVAGGGAAAGEGPQLGQVFAGGTATMARGVSMAAVIEAA